MALKKAENCGKGGPHKTLLLWQASITHSHPISLIFVNSKVHGIYPATIQYIDITHKTTLLQNVKNTLISFHTGEYYKYC